MEKFDRHSCVIKKELISAVVSDLLMTRVTKSLGTILWIGLVARMWDITENIVFNAFRGITPLRIFQFIAGA